MKRVALRRGGPIRPSTVHWLLAPTRSNIAAWHDLLRLQNRAIPHLVCSNTTEVSFTLSEFDFDFLLCPGCVCTSMKWKSLEACAPCDPITDRHHRHSCHWAGLSPGCRLSGSLGVPASDRVRSVADLLRTCFEVQVPSPEETDGPFGREWTRRDLNPRPPACKAGSLPAEIRAHGGASHDDCVHGPASAGSARTRQTGEPRSERYVPGRPAVDAPKCTDVA